MNEKQIRELVEAVIKNMDESEIKRLAEEAGSGSKKTAGALQDDGMIPDIRQDDYTSYLEVENPANPTEFLRIKKQTDARIGLGRCGNRYRTKAYLRILADHAGSLDAVMSEAPEYLIEENHLFPVQTLCRDKDEYLSRPDLGRQFSDEMKESIKKSCTMDPDVQIIISEGLSSTAMERNTNDLLASLQQGLKLEGLSSGTPIYVKYSRVPAMDVITELTRAKITIMLIGERPGLSTYASLSAYMTYGGHVGMPEAGRNVVSNIHANGINPTEAGAHIAAVARKMMDQKASGTDLQLF